MISESHFCDMSYYDVLTRKELPTYLRIKFRLLSPHVGIVALQYSNFAVIYPIPLDALPQSNPGDQ